MDQEKTWRKVLEKIKEEISSHNFKAWFSQTSLSAIENDKITISVPSAFIKGQLIARYEVLIKTKASEVLEKEVVLDYLIDPSKFLKVAPTESNEEDIFHIPTTPTTHPHNILLNPKYTLETFVVGLTNNLAYAASQAVVQNPGTSYNPLFIYGPSGVGKTHITQGIGNALLKKNPYLKLIYVSSERFMNDLVDSIQNRRTGDFRQRYRNCDILLVDDIQFISGKDSTQEEFFHTFNELHSKNAQVVLTSDRTPNEIQKLESRLASRFQGGLMVDIQLPDFDTRIAIIKAKLSEKGENLPEESIKVIAEATEANTREIEGKLTQVISTLKLTGKQSDPDTVREIIGRTHIPATQRLDYRKVMSSVNQYFNIKMTELIGPRRQKELVLPRQIAMFIMYEECGLPFERIGQLLGGRDHTTVLHGVEKIRGVASRDREVQRMLVELKQQLTQ